MPETIVGDHGFVLCIYAQLLFINDYLHPLMHSLASPYEIDRVFSNEIEESDP
jgi:hypothetical protein